MTDSQIRLRPLTMDDVPILDGIEHDADAPAGGFEWFGFSKPGRLAENVAGGNTLGEIGDPGGSLAVATDDEVVGMLSWHPQIYGPNRFAAINFGIGILPAHRGKGYGTEAQRLLADYLFAHLLVNRIEAQTDVENLGEQRALEKAGFFREGVLRGAQYRNGEWHDLVGYAMTREDHRELRAKAATASVRTGFTA